MGRDDGPMLGARWAKLGKLVNVFQAGPSLDNRGGRRTGNRQEPPHPASSPNGSNQMDADVVIGALRRPQPTTNVPLWAIWARMLRAMFAVGRLDDDPARPREGHAETARRRSTAELA